MDYTELSEEYKKEYSEKFVLKDKFKVKLCREDPTKFAFYMLGKRMRDYQSYLLDNAIKNQYNLWCVPRQLGKTVAIIVLALWAAWFNKYSNKLNERLETGTKVYIMSRTEDQAKEVLLRIREIIRDGDAHMSKILRKNAKHMTDFFSSQICEPNNAFQISFANGSTIKCVPPTDAVRGKSADWFFIDEAAFLRHDNPDGLYVESIEPTISQTHGRMIISSTPRGQQGFFYKLLDPFDNFVGNDYFKAWFHYKIFDNEEHLKRMELKEKEMRSNGEGRSFEQEYEAKFTSASENFFDSEKIDEVTGAEYKESESSGGEYVLGVDYGMVDSRTAIAVSKYDVENEKIITVYVKRFVKGRDINDVIPFIEGLKERFGISKIIVDDCPGGYAINQAMINKGWNVYLFSFSKEKTETYCAYRAKLNQKKVGFLPDKDLLLEMKGLQQEETVTGKLKIFKGGGLTDDLCDALIMSASHWLKQDNSVCGLVVV